MVMAKKKMIESGEEIVFTIKNEYEEEIPDVEDEVWSGGGNVSFPIAPDTGQLTNVAKNILAREEWSLVNLWIGSGAVMVVFAGWIASECKNRVKVDKKA